MPGCGDPVERDFVERFQETMKKAIYAIRHSTIDPNDASTTAAMYHLPYAPGPTRFLLDRMAQLDGTEVPTDSSETTGYTGPITIGILH